MYDRVYDLAYSDSITDKVLQRKIMAGRERYPDKWVPSEDSYRDLELLTGCRGPGFKYGVDKFVNFDNGFVFPKYFTYKGPASESFSFEIESVKNINAQKVKASDKMMKELDRDFRQKLARGLAREADASDIGSVRKLADD